MLIGHFTEQPWQDDASGLMGTQSTDLSISNDNYNPQIGEFGGGVQRPYRRVIRLGLCRRNAAHALFLGCGLRTVP